MILITYKITMQLSLRLVMKMNAMTFQIIIIGMSNFELVYFSIIEYMLINIINILSHQR